MKNNQLLINQKSLSTVILLAMSLLVASPAFAKEEWSTLYGNTGLCEICHTSSVGTKNNTKSSANSAYQSGGLNPGLKNYVANILGSQAPVIPNYKPILNSVNAQWDVIAGEAISIPLVVNDAEDDAFAIVTKAKPAGAGVAEAGIDTATQLPKWDFTWTPSDAQKNKIYKIKFIAKETSTAKKLSSAPITVKIRVWPAGDQDKASVSKFILSAATWKDDVLTLKGKVVLNKILTAAEKTEFLNRKDLTVDIYQGTTPGGVAIAIASNISFSPNGTWTISQPLVAPFACNVSLSFEAWPAARKISKAPSSCTQ